MQSSGPLDALLLWGLFIAILLLVLVSVEGGYRLGRYRRSRSKEDKGAPVGAMVGAALGLLAFTGRPPHASIRGDRSASMRPTRLGRRAGMLPDQREEIRALLRDYVDARLEAVRSGNVTAGIRRSEHLQDQLWAQAVAVGEHNDCGRSLHPIAK